MTYLAIFFTGLIVTVWAWRQFKQEQKRKRILKKLNFL